NSAAHGVPSPYVFHLFLRRFCFCGEPLLSVRRAAWLTKVWLLVVLRAIELRLATGQKEQGVVVVFLLRSSGFLLCKRKEAPGFDGTLILIVLISRRCCVGRLWDLDGNETAVLRLHSPGMSVCWHPQEAFKLMVAEKKGTIRFYDLVTQQAILSLDSGHSGPLMSADWCLTNTIKVGAVVGNDWLIWDITRSRTSNLYTSFLFRWSFVNENLFATTGCPGKISSQVFIHHLGHPQPVMIGSSPVGSGLSWHRMLPLCVVGGDRKLCFWMTEM
uniref:Nucleoporin 37 n=1 Tax=Xiphophorus couchianus TaxID=32473 RepID=A0A3B5MAK5_9TELE